MLNFRRSRCFEKEACQREIAGKSDLEIGFPVKNGDWMIAVGNERGDFICRARVMSLQSGEEEIMAGGLWGFHGEEIRAGNRFDKRSGGIRTMQRVSNRMGGRGGVVNLCGGKDFLNESGSYQRASGIVHGDKFRRIRGESLQTVEHRGAALGSASDDVAKLGKRSGEFRELRETLRCADQHGAVDRGTVLKRAQRPFENTATTQ